MQEKSKQLRYVIWLSVVASLGGFLFGYDTAVISGTVDQVSSQFSLDDIKKGWYVGCALVGSIAGVLFAGDAAIATSANRLSCVFTRTAVPHF